MSIYSDATAQGLSNIRKLAEQQKNQRALKIKNRILKQTHDMKWAESLSPITIKLQEGSESTQKQGKVFEKSQRESNIPQASIEKTPPPQQIEKIEGVIYDTELENTINRREK